LRISWQPLQSYASQPERLKPSAIKIKKAALPCSQGNPAVWLAAHKSISDGALDATSELFTKSC
jgi:hypothetical protein